MMRPAFRYFAEVVQHGSIRAAANKLGVAQSAVSRQIKALELDLGAPLLERRPRGVVLTPAGEIVFSYTREAAFHIDRLSTEIDALKGLRRGRVRIHAIEAVVPHLLPRAINAFLAEFPGINFEVEIASSDRIQTALHDGRAEIGIGFCTEQTRHLRTVFQVKASLLAMVTPVHPLASRRKISVHEFEAWPTAVTSAMSGSRNLIDAVCTSAKVEFRPALETNSTELLHRFALTGQGIAVMTRLSCLDSIQSRQLAALSFEEPEMAGGTIEVLTLVGRRLPVPAERFLVPLRRALDVPRL